MRLASYNIHGAVGTDGRRLIERIAAVIAEIAPDVIGLQEVESRPSRGGRDQAQLLAEALGMTAVTGPILHEGPGWYGNAILSRHPVGEVERWRFAEHSGELRAVLGVTVTPPAARPLQVVTTHLDLCQRYRLRQAQALGRLLGAEPDRPRVVLGDFNEWWPLARSWAAFQHLGEVPAGRRTFPSWCPLLHLDRVIARGCALRGALQRHVTPASRRASDHLPVYVDLTL